MADLTDSHCWAPDEKQVFKVVKIRDREGNIIKVSDIDPKNGLPLSPIYDVPQDKTHQIFAIEELHAPPGDLIQLTDVHRAGILHALRHRFERDLIYTSVGPILVALNPFKWIRGVYDEDIKKKYADGELNLSENPHVFAMAHDAHIGLQMGKNQSLIISGESGAGKTEATKQCLAYLATVAGSSTGLQNKIIQASPILEAWGNAKTLRNNNSSRFGKFIEIWFSANYDIVGSSNTTYLLEKSRVVFQEAGERNYHIFYQLMFGASESVREQVLLTHLAKNPDTVNYINQSGCIQIEGVDEVEEYGEVTNAMKAMGFSETEEVILLRAISGILHLGNLDFEEDPNNTEACQFTAAGSEFHRISSELFGVDPHFFRSALLYKAVKSGKRSSVVYSNYSPLVAAENRNALAKEIYNRCFDFIVTKINNVLNVDGAKSGGMIGILDIFGFEIFVKNSFEQLCINLANEALQQHFNVNIFQHEMEIYQSEGIVIPDLSYNDNQDVLDMIMKKPKGLIPMLDEEGQVPRGSTEGFINKFTKVQAANPRLKYRSGGKDFVVVHYAGEVRYDPFLFMTKNKDTLSQDLVDIMSSSSIELLSELFKEPVADIAPPISSPATPQRGISRMSSVGGGGLASSNKQTVGTRFRIQLESLIANLNTTEPRYIRCIKPNQVKKPDIFEAYLTNEQLTYSGVFEAVVIMQNGYPFRMSHTDFFQRYHMLALRCLTWRDMFKPSDPKQRCSALTASLASHLNETVTNCHVGKTMVFYRSEQHRFLEKERKSLWDSSLSILQRSIRTGMTSYLLQNIKKMALKCETCIDNGNIDDLGSHTDILINFCERFTRITYVSLYNDLRLLSQRYYKAAHLQKEIELSLQTLLSQKDNFEDGLLSIFDEINAELNKAKMIDFHETFNGREIVIVWTENETFLQADQELESLRIIKSVKSNLKSGITNQDEILLKEWVQKLNSYRRSGQVTADFCAQEEKEAVSIMEAAQKQYSDFIGSTFAALKEGKFHCDIADVSENHSLSDQSSISVRVDPRPIYLYVEKNKKLSHSSNSMQIKQTLILCEKLYQLRQFASSPVVDWAKLWDMLQPWKRYYARVEDGAGGEGGARSSFIRKEITTDLYRSASMARSNSMVAGARRQSVGDDANAHESLLIPWLSDLSVEVTEEIQNMVKCCLEAVYFRQLQTEVSSNRIPSVLTFKNVRLPLSAMDHTLKILEMHFHNFSLNQVSRYYDAKERWNLRRGVCGRSAEMISSALSGTNKSHLPANDPELLAAQQFCHLYTCEEDLIAALSEEGTIGHEGHINFQELQCQRLHNAISNADGIVFSESHGTAVFLNNSAPSGWQLLVQCCKKIVEVRRAAQADDLEAALPLIEGILKREPWKTAHSNFMSNGTLSDRTLRTKELFESVVSLSFSTPSSIIESVDQSLLHHDTDYGTSDDSVKDFSSSSPSSDQSPEISVLLTTIKCLNKYYNEIRHILQIRKIRTALSTGVLSGDIGELNLSSVNECDLESALAAAVSANVLIPTAETVSLVKSCYGIVKLRYFARGGDWDNVLNFICNMFGSLSQSFGAKTSTKGPVNDASLVESSISGFATSIKRIHSACQAEYGTFFSEVMDLQTRNKLTEACSIGCVRINEQTGDLNCFLTSVDKLGDAINFADMRTEKSIECQYLYQSAKLLFCLRFQVMTNRWENANSSTKFPSSLLLNYPTENVMIELRDELLVLKQKLGGAEEFQAAIEARIQHLLVTTEYFSCPNFGHEQDNELYNPLKVDGLLQNPLEFLKKYLGNTVSSSRRKSVVSTRQSIDRGSVSVNAPTGVVAPDFAVADLLIYASLVGYHESVAEEISWIASGFRERNIRINLVLAASIGCVRGSVDTLDSTGIEVEKLSQCIESSRFFLQTCASSPLMHMYHDVAFQLLNIRLAVDGCAEGVDLLSYFSIEKLDHLLLKLDTLEFPTAEIHLVIDHIKDSHSISTLADAIHLGRPQFYMGRFDTKQVGYEHLLTYLEIAKRLVKRSDRLDRLMFYAELCVLLRKALINHQWDISELGERSNEPKSRGISVKQCLDDYAQAEIFFQRRMAGIPPKALIDEFKLTRREWDRRLILQAFPSALQSGQMTITAGSIELREVKYTRLQQQIDCAMTWAAETGVKDPDLDLLVRASNEIVETRMALISVHMNYRRNFDPNIRSRSATVESININKNVSDASRGLEKIVQTFHFLDDAINDACNTVESLLVQPYKFVTEWKDVESKVAKMEVSSRLRSTKLQVEILATETFERSFAAGVLKVLHNLETRDDFVSMGAKNKSVIHNLMILCKAHVLRGNEMAKIGNSSLRFSSRSEMLYNSSIVLMSLFRAEALKNYEKLDREWKNMGFVNQIGSERTPGLHLLEQTLYDNSSYTVQSILRTTMAMKSSLHPCVTKQVARACRHVEDEITMMELSLALQAGPVTGRVGTVSTDAISIDELETALHRAHETSSADESYPHILLSLIGNSNAQQDVTWRAPCRLKYSPKFTVTEVSIIDMTVGWGSGLASQMYTEKWGNKKRNVVETVVNSIGNGVKKGSKWGVLKAHLKAGNIVPQFKYLEEDAIKEALLNPALTTISLIQARRPDVIQFRNSCEMICELRRCMMVRDYSTAFEMLSENFGRPGFTFSDMFRVIYQADFSIHPLAIEEFALISLEVCESYWRVLARKALSDGILTGNRGRLNITVGGWQQIDEVLQLLDGLLEISRESIILRELCYMVRYMRRTAILGGRGTVRALCKDTAITGVVDSKSKNGSLRDLSADDVFGAEFIDEAIFNAITIVQAISMKTDMPEEATCVTEAEIALAASARVYECLGVIDADNISSTLLNELTLEAYLVRDHSKFILAGIALDKAFAMEGMWFSYTSSALEVSSEVMRLLQTAVDDALVLKMDASKPVEARWALMLTAAIDVLKVMDGCIPKQEAPKYISSSFSFLSSSEDPSTIRLKALDSLGRLSRYYGYCDLIRPPEVLNKYHVAITNALSEQTKIDALLEVIAGTRESTAVDGFEGVSIEAATSAGSNLSKMASFRGNVIWRIALMHVNLRERLASEEWSIVKSLADAIIAADIFNVRSTEVSSALTKCQCLKILRSFQQGITACILPPYPGWSSFSNCKNLIAKISDYYIRQAVEDCEQYISEFNKNELGGRKLGRNLSEIFLDFPTIPELLNFSYILIDLVSALRGSRWTAYGRNSIVISERRPSRKNAIGAFSLGTSQSLYLEDGKIVVDNNDSGENEEVRDPVSLEDITNALEEECIEECNYFKYYKSVEDALNALKDLLRTSSVIDSSYGVGLFLEYTVNTVATELQFIGLDDRVKLAIEDCVITGVPGRLKVPEKSYAQLKAFCDALAERSSDSDASHSKPIRVVPLMLRCSRLCRGYLSARLLLQALKLISEETLSESSVEWNGLYRVLMLYRYMASLEWTDPEIECDFLMTSPDYSAAYTTYGDLLSMKEYEFVSITDRRINTLKAASLTVIKAEHNAESAEPFSSSTIPCSHDETPLQGVCKDVLGIDLQDLMRPTEEIAPFMQLLDKHCAFKVAEDMYYKELKVHKAEGAPGELITEHINAQPLQVVLQILIDSGLTVDGMPGKRLFDAASALSELRITQRNVGPLLHEAPTDPESLKFEDLLHGALSRALAVLSDEDDFMSGLYSSDTVTGYLRGAQHEITNAKLDIQQRSFAKRLCDAITSNRINLDGEENNLAHGDTVVSRIIAPVAVEKLSDCMSECFKFGKDKLCPIVSKLYDTACALNEVRVTVMSRSWTDVLDILENEQALKVVNAAEIPRWMTSFKHELIASQRLALVSLAVEACEYALMVGTIPASPLGGVQPSRLNCTVVSRALTALDKVPNEWRYETVRSYIFTLESINLLRRHAANGDWNVVHDLAMVTLHPERLALKPLIQSALVEINAALVQSLYYLSEWYLLTALSSQWRMRGSVGACDGSCLSATTLKYAIRKVEELGCENDYITSLLTSARVIYDLRRAQLYGLWLSHNHGVHFNAGQIENSILQSCLPIINMPAEELERVKDDQDAGGVTTGFLSPSAASIFIDDAGSSNVPQVPSLVKWFMRHSEIDQDFLPPSEEDGDILSVEDVLQGADYVENVMGLSEVISEELQFAREELCYRVVAITLLRALSTPGCHGAPGALVVDSPDQSLEDGVPSIAEAIEMAERNIDICSRGHCKWLLRDAKLLYRIRTYRRERNWSDVREVILEALDQNDVEALNEFNEPRVSMIQDEIPLINGDNHKLVHQPILAPVWTEIMIIRADFSFYACLADFAQEISNGARRPEGDTDPKDRRSLTAILHILLRTRAASLLWPNSSEFNRLIEAEEAALELRSQRIFDSGHFPSTNVITRVEQIRNRDFESGLVSYADLLMPEINLLSDILNVQSMVDSMENALNIGQGYLRCPIGHISRQEMELDLLGEAVKACLLHCLDTSGTNEQIKLVKLGNVLYNIRAAAADSQWDKVMDLIQDNMHILRGRTSISEELSRLKIEAQNSEACSILRTALSSDRFSNVLELVKRISKHKMLGQPIDVVSLASTSESSFNIDVGLDAAGVGASQNLNSMSNDVIPRTASRGSLLGKRSSFHDNSWKSFSEELNYSMDGEDTSNRVNKLEVAINLAMSVHHKSDVTASLLKAAVLIRSLRTAISSGYWDEVQQIVSEESNYRNTRVPAETLEEIRVAKAALHYRNCMIALSKGIIVGRATGSPGNMNLSSIECIMLQSAISQAEVLEIDADPGALAMLDIARYVCLLRQAIMAARWFSKTDSSNPAPSISAPSPRNVLFGSPAQISAAALDFSEFDDHSVSVTADTANETLHLRTDSVFSIFSDDDHNNSASGVPVSGLRKNTSVEEIVSILKAKIASLPEDWDDDNKNTENNGNVRKESITDYSAADETIASDSTLDWIALQGRAIRSAKNEVNLLDENLKERRRQEYIVSALECIPPAVQMFRSGTGAAIASNRNVQSVSTRTLDTMPQPISAATVGAESRGTPVSSKDLYLARPLEVALNAAKAIPGVLSDDTAKLIRTAELILSFRQAMNDLEIENFKKLIESARLLTEKDMISGHYGVFELSTYRSATMTVSLSKAELMKAIRSGTVRGLVHSPSYEAIEVEPLHYWVEAHEASAKDMTIALKHALVEARILCNLRRKCKARDWTEVKKIVEEEYEDLKGFQYAKDEVEFIILACRYQLDIASLTDELHSDPLPRTLDEQFAYTSVRMSEINRAGRTANAVLLYIARKKLVDGSLMENLKKRNAALVDELFDEAGLTVEIDSVASVSAAVKLMEQEHYRLALECYAIKRLLKLWSAISNKKWQIEPIAAGMVHAFSNPHDPFLGLLMNSLRQHEVVHRLASVHNQLHMLQIKGDKKIKNIKHAVNASVAFLLRTRTSDVGISVEKAAPSKVSVDVLRTVRYRSQHFFLAPKKSEEEKQKERDMNRKPPPLSTETSHFETTIKNRKASIFSSITTPTKVKEPNLSELDSIDNESDPIHEVFDQPNLQEKPVAVPPLIKMKAKRRLSIGEVAQDINVVPSEKIVMGDTSKKLNSELIPKGKRRISIGSVADEMRGFMNTKVLRKEAEVDSVAQILCIENWSEDPEFSVMQFETVRNTLIDQVIQMRLMWGCMEGCIEEDGDGNILTDPITIDLLTVALSDVRKVEFYTHQNKSDFSFSSKTRSIIHCANGILHCRQSAAAEKYEDLLYELRRLRYIVDSHSMKRMDLPEICPTKTSEAEFDRFVRLACQMYSLVKFKDALNLLLTRTMVDVQLLQHPIISSLGGKEISGISPKSVVTPVHALILLLGMSIKSALIAAHNGNLDRVLYEEDVCMSLLSDPQWDRGNPIETQFESIIAIFKMMGGYHFSLNGTDSGNSATRAPAKVPSRPAPDVPRLTNGTSIDVRCGDTVTAAAHTTIPFSSHSIDNNVPESETINDLERVRKIFFAFALTLDTVSYHQSFQVPSDLVEELKLLIRRLESSLSSINNNVMISPWMVLVSQLLLLCARPAYRMDNSGRYLHNLPNAVCDLLRDCCGHFKVGSITELNDKKFKQNGGLVGSKVPHRLVLKDFKVSFNITNVTSFLRRLISGESEGSRSKWVTKSKYIVTPFRTDTVGASNSDHLSNDSIDSVSDVHLRIPAADITNCIKKVRMLYLSQARAASNALDIAEQNSTGLIKVALLDVVDVKANAENSIRNLKFSAITKRLFSRFGVQCEFLLRVLAETESLCAGTAVVARSKHVRSTIHKRRKQIKY